MKKKKKIKLLEEKILQLEKKLQPKEEKKSRNSTYLNYHVCDQGHYGTTYCGNCNENLSNKEYEKTPRGNGTFQLSCPSCHYNFDQESQVSY